MDQLLDQVICLCHLLIDHNLFSVCIKCIFAHSGLFWCMVHQKRNIDGMETFILCLHFPSFTLPVSCLFNLVICLHKILLSFDLSSGKCHEDWSHSLICMGDKLQIEWIHFCCPVILSYFTYLCCRQKCRKKNKYLVFGWLLCCCIHCWPALVKKQ